jgi:hypothetical protein
VLGARFALDESKAVIQRRVKAMGFDYEAFSNKFWDSDLAAIEIYQSIKNHVMDGAGIPMRYLRNLGMKSLELAPWFCK